MNNSTKEKTFSFKEIAEQCGVTEAEVIRMARENGLIEANGRPTAFAVSEGLLSQNNSNKMNAKIESKIESLYQEAEKMERELKSIVNSNSRDWVRVSVLVTGMNIIFNQMNTLRELY